MDFVLEHKWVFLIAAEVFFWIFMLTFLVLRYWFKLHKMSVLFMGLFIVNDLWIATMGFFDYLKTGEFASYQVIILILIVYAFTYGKSDFKKLDYAIQKRVAKMKGEPMPDLHRPVALYGKDLARKERKQFTVHFLVFCLVHIVLLFVAGLSDQFTQNQSIQQMLTEWFNSKDGLYPFDNQTMNNLSRIWTIILVVDGVISLSYTVFPKQEKKHVSLDR
ncbi:hypothetical protein ACFFJY_17260 [Fictibacillus aquaticus]|uniref:Integral membrane protein n=1 Tax=Fictibacillus aquaticus TaxID=2021314 RepID=A0A235F7N5_9BACL|nr:hypothetical protein [Fictibacillus aquaticus]OYD56705.1 hypothetical protein CGZ90_16995 [Fictibacillus aquaticus]